MASKPSRPVRQWRITVTEGQLEDLMRVSLAWRTFPSAANEWDGTRHSQFVITEGRIASADDLRAVLLAAVEGEWWEDVRRTYSRPLG